MLLQRNLQAYQEKNLLQVVQKLLLGIVGCQLKNTMLKWLITSPTIKTLLQHISISMPTQILKEPIGTQIKD